VQSQAIEPPAFDTLKTCRGFHQHILRVRGPTLKMRMIFNDFPPPQRKVLYQPSIFTRILMVVMING
jgi:hypothetical protein